MLKASKIENIYKYQVLKECGLEFCFDDVLNEGMIKSFIEKEAKEKLINVIYRAVDYFKKIGDKNTLEKFTSRVKDIWYNEISYQARLKIVITFLATVVISSYMINAIIGKEKVNGKEIKVVDTAEGKKVEGLDATEEFKNANDTSVKTIQNKRKVATANSFTITERGLELMKSHEKLRLEPYHATKHEKNNKIFTIGYGHVIKETDPDWLKNATAITEEQADELFAQDVSAVENGLARIFRNNLDVHQREASFYPQSFIDVMVSLAFNMGVYGVSQTDLFKDLSKIRYDSKTGMADMSDFDVVVKKLKTTSTTQKGKVLGGLQRRRMEEYHYIYNNLYEDEQ